MSVKFVKFITDRGKLTADVNKTMMEKIKQFWKFWYYQYILHTGLYMLESWERGIFTSFVLALLGMACYTAYLYLPGHVVMLYGFVEHYVHLFGSDYLATSSESTLHVENVPSPGT